MSWEAFVTEITNDTLKMCNGVADLPLMPS